MNCIDWLGLYPPELFGLDRVELIISLGFERVRFFCTVNSSLLRGQGSSSVTDDLIPDCLEIQWCWICSFLFILFFKLCVLIATGPKYVHLTRYYKIIMIDRLLLDTPGAYHEAVHARISSVRSVNQLRPSHLFYRQIHLSCQYGDR
jgi:hypothetical protein